MTTMARSYSMRHPFPRWGWWGVLLIVVFWPVNWFWPGLRTHLAFFPLWLGYALTLDALAYRQKGSSLVSRSPRRYALLFVISAPVWWFFEGLNTWVQNWKYLGREHFDDVTYAVLATVAFSTVMPAVFSAAEWMSGWRWIQRFRRGPRWVPTRRTALVFFLLGIGGLGLLYRWPRYAFPLVWVAPYFLTESLNLWRGHRTLLDWTRKGDWRPLAALAFGALFTGFFWEFWNVFSYPKWVYDVPFVGFWHVFEMPLLGYLGYLPFAFELFAFYHLIMGLAGFPKDTYLVAGLEGGDFSSSFTTRSFRGDSST